MHDLKVIKEFLKKYNVNISKITLDTKITNLGIDSLDLMMMVLDIEKQYNLNLSDSDLMNIKTIRDLLNMINKKN